MRFSEHFAINRTSEDDWFDPHLTVDTKLFIDPVLLLESGGQWAKGHQELIDHFVHCYKLVAKSISKDSQSAKAARKLLTFPEPYELGLGYTAHGTKGAGSGSSFASTMADGIAVAIAAGLKEPEHIEEIGILNEGIGADRISDAAANVLKHRFIQYTQEISRRHGVPLKSHRVKNTRVTLEVARWHTEEAALPTNPATGKPIILVPTSILNKLPTLNADDWFYSDFNDDIRASINLPVGKSAAKADIVTWARKHPDRVRDWAREQTSREDLRGYDFEEDPIGVVHWDRAPVEFVAENPLASRPVRSHDDLVVLMADVIQNFRRYIQEQRGWSLLWNDDGTRKPEEAVQLLFLGFAQQYLRQFNVELDREVELGRGPTDFKVSSGTNARLIIEVKKLDNGRFWNGIRDQLPSYLVSDDATHGWFISVQYGDTKTQRDRLKQLPAEIGVLSQKIGKQIRHTAIDAQKPLSASNIKN